MTRLDVAKQGLGAAPRTLARSGFFSALGSTRTVSYSVAQRRAGAVAGARMSQLLVGARLTAVAIAARTFIDYAPSRIYQVTR